MERTNNAFFHPAGEVVMTEDGGWDYRYPPTHPTMRNLEMTSEGWKLKQEEPPAVLPDAADILIAADAAVNGGREQLHGDKTASFPHIAAVWSAYLGVAVTAVDVAMMMGQLKMVRSRHGGYNPDDFVDLCGYAACGGELAARLKQQPADKRDSAKPRGPGQDFRYGERSVDEFAAVRYW